MRDAIGKSMDNFLSISLCRSFCVLVGCVAILFGSSGCVGAQKNMRFEKLAYPASTSPFLYDADGTVLSGDQLKKVGTVEINDKIRSFFWTAASTNGIDVDEAINSQIQDVEGDGVVNVTVSVKPCGINGIPLIHILPFVPSCMKTQLRGDIVVADKNRSTAPMPEINTPQNTPKGAVFVREGKTMTVRLSKQCVPHSYQVFNADGEQLIQEAQKEGVNVVQIISVSSYSYNLNPTKLTSASVRFWRCPNPDSLYK